MFPCVYNNCAAIEIIKLKRDLKNYRYKEIMYIIVFRDNYLIISRLFV